MGRFNGCTIFRLYYEDTIVRKMDDLIRFLRIPSISADPAYAGEVRRAAEFVRAWLHRAGLEHAQLVDSPDPAAHPIVYADWTHAPGQPTLLLYGHYDVQPPDPLEEWLTPPFEPNIREGNLYARGAADDKGQLFILMESVAQSLRKNGGLLPVNVKFLIEGEEESGGGHIDRFVTENSSTLAADAAVICDTAMFAPGIPSITTGLRGIIYGEILVRGASHDLHSGDYGGVAPNAVEAVAQIVSSLKSRDGKIQVPGFYDRVIPPSAAELDAWSRLPFDPEDFRRREVGSPSLTGEPGFDPLTRLWGRPTLEIHGIRGGYTGEGSKTVIPANASAKISLRLVPGQIPAEAADQVATAIASACPKGVAVKFVLTHAAPPCLIDPETFFISKAAQAMDRVFGGSTVYIRCGGSIPIVNLFKQKLGVPAVLPGFGLPDDQIHAPNEKLCIANYIRGISSMIEYYELLATSTNVAAI
jgi:acetylornithine deacetylase/succinyl-diaminopimelate desuccinylase-like protein